MIYLVGIPVSWHIKDISCGGFYYPNYLYWSYNYKSWKMESILWSLPLGSRIHVLNHCHYRFLLRVHFGTILRTNFNINFYILY
jgi:hypothetical protein